MARRGARAHRYRVVGPDNECECVLCGMLRRGRYVHEYLPRNDVEWTPLRPECLGSKPRASSVHDMVHRIVRASSIATVRAVLDQLAPEANAPRVAAPAAPSGDALGVLREALIAVLWNEVADSPSGACCGECEDPARLGEPGKPYPICKAMRALSYGQHWRDTGEICDHRADAGRTP